MTKSWDLIVVGAGSAGAAFAARSAENGHRVLLLEAGLDYRSVELPEVWRSPNPLPALLDPGISEDFLWQELMSTRTDVQPPALYWRGRGLGGSSTINGQIAIRPPVEDFEEWAESGCVGWSWDEVVPYFCALESDGRFGDLPYHGSTGPIPIYRTPESGWGAVDLALRDAALRAGFTWSEDANAPGTTGISPYPINSHLDRRVSTNDAYIEPARNLKNFTVRGGACVDKLLFSRDRAIGVELASTGEQQFADEIVLSAGVIHSPTILMRSGIGPAGHLESIGISVRQDLPVGQYMQDHPYFAIGLPLTAEATAGEADRHTNCCIRYSSSPSAESNDMMIVSLNQNLLSMETADTKRGAGAVGVWVNQPYSRGSVQLVSKDPDSQPLVRQRMLSDSRDMSRLREGARQLGEFISGGISTICTDELGRLDREVWQRLDGDDASLDKYLRAVTVDAQHGTSTCVMGSADSPTSVVDSDCKVLGIQGVRVVDASIFPTVPRANTNLATIMAGELMADRMR